MKKFIFLFLSIISFKLSAQEINIIPQPVSIKTGKNTEKFIIDQNTEIISNDSLSNSALFLQNYIQQFYNIKLRINPNSTNKKNVVKLEIISRLLKNLNEYELISNNNQTIIYACSENGLFYGIQTLIQLIPETKSQLQIPAVSITDYPRFDYRGMHLDVSRHFFDVAFVKQYIDYLALHKMNYFHWHLTDDHGWRIEIKKYPKLTEIGAWRNGSIIGLWPGQGNEHIKYQVLPAEVKITPKDALIKTDGIRHGGYYTQEQIKDVVDYAAKRYITIIPEIEMPAHSMALLAAYPELGTEPGKKYEVAQTWGMMNKYNNVLQASDTTFKFLENVLTEVMALFPSQYIHIGGDEASKVWWKRSAVSQEIMKANGLKNESELQSYFIRRIEKFVNSKGKTIIGWNEILQGGLAPNAVVMSWQGEKGGIDAAKQNHKAIMTPEDKMYFNHGQFLKEDSLTANKFSPLIDVYNYEPVPAELSAEQAKYIWGAQGCLWSEYITNPAKVQYLLFPRLDALSEILWSPKEKRNYPDFQKRLKTQFKRYDLMGITYSKRYLEN
ncbi:MULTISPECIES: beta-N-acetylhexosaminidase [unclassified Pedobacter]|uniref:beta-N-acetylhexosaminidase n=1 Tax=unclassified Pedobacter TaxID=2628915 RepID=UPI001E0D5629|nr:MULTISPECIES: beta-N-acetylhexosaminidase [unclassified Pedobacter]CAH0311716.1 Beta-hexosaminidase [Pedobacter sp. Bi36]CAH0319050.1 Beta-hexosaminidase [Pedobacter sp. Bi126]